MNCLLMLPGILYNSSRRLESVFRFSTVNNDDDDDDDDDDDKESISSMPSRESRLNSSSLGIE